jgi:heme ABC exporter ATP-binding subunit CcmA
VSVITARGLAQRYGARQLLHPLDLDVAAGERLAVLGPNGAGKTTLLRMLATAARPAAGSLQVLGRDAVRERTELRRRVGYLAHEPGLYPNLTALENLRFFCSLHGLIRPRAEATLDLLGLREDADRRAAELSRGRQQRLALARSLLHEPELWILDEPDSSLDAAGRELLGSLMEGRTVVMATHDGGLAASLCSRSITLDEGRLAAAPELEVLSS